MMKIGKMHYQPDGSWQLMQAEYCGSISHNGVQTTNRIQYVDCLKCINKYYKSVKKGA